MEENLKTEALGVKTTLDLPIDVREQIKAKAAELKAKNSIRKVFVIIVEGDTEMGEKPYFIGYFSRPNMMQFSQYMNFIQKDITQASKMLAQNTFIDGDKALIDDEDLFLYGTMPQLNHVIDSRNSDIVKR